MNELRLAARDFVTDPARQSDRVGEAAAALSALLKKTRLELAPEQQDMIDGVTAAAGELPRRHRARHRADRAPRRTGRGLAAGARAVRAGDRRRARPGVGRDNLFQAQNQIAEALLAHDPIGGRAGRASACGR